MRLFLYIILALLPLHVMAKSTLATANADKEQQLLKLLDSYIDKNGGHQDLVDLFEITEHTKTVPSEYEGGEEQTVKYWTAKFVGDKS